MQSNANLYNSPATSGNLKKLKNVQFFQTVLGNVNGMVIYFLSDVWLGTIQR